MNINKLKTMALPDDFRDELKQEKQAMTYSRSNTIGESQTKAIVTSFQKRYDMPTELHAKAVIAVLFQQGGTSRSCDGNMAITIFGKEIKLAGLRKCLQDNNCAKQERKLARSLASELFEMSREMGLIGNQYRKIQREKQERVYTDLEKAWLSDFQCDNLNCPTDLRLLITESFPKRSLNKKQKKSGK